MTGYNDKVRFEQNTRNRTMTLWGFTLMRYSMCTYLRLKSEAEANTIIDNRVIKAPIL